MPKLILLISLTLAATLAHAEDDSVAEGASLDQVKCDSGKCFSSVKNIKATDSDQRDTNIVNGVLKGDSPVLGTPNGAVDI